MPTEDYFMLTSSELHAAVQRLAADPRAHVPVSMQAVCCALWPKDQDATKQEQLRLDAAAPTPQTK